MNKKEIEIKAKALSSETRLNLIELIKEESKTVKQLKEEYVNNYDQKTRETIYRELEKLVEAEILEKNYKKDIKGFFYSLKVSEIEFSLKKEN